MARRWKRWAAERAAEVLGELEASGLSDVEFARRRQIHPQRLRRWRRRLQVEERDAHLHLGSAERRGCGWRSVTSCSRTSSRHGHGRLPRRVRSSVRWPVCCRVTGTRASRSTPGTMASGRRAAWRTCAASSKQQSIQKTHAPRGRWRWCRGCTASRSSPGCGSSRPSSGWRSAERSVPMMEVATHQAASSAALPVEGGSVNKAATWRVNEAMSASLTWAAWRAISRGAVTRRPSPGSSGRRVESNASLPPTSAHVDPGSPSSMTGS